MNKSITDFLREIEPWFVTFTLVGILISLVNFWQNNQHRERERVVHAFDTIAIHQPGNTGKVQAIEYLNKKGISLKSIDVSWHGYPGKDLQNLILRDKVDLRGANFAFADLQGAQMREANLQQANFSGAYLHGAFLHKSNFTNACMIRTHFPNADLSEANFTNANITGAAFGEATGLTQNQIDSACIYENKENGTGYPMSLPEGISPPKTCKHDDKNQDICKDMFQKTFEDSGRPPGSDK